jgi:peroxiredoxin
MNNPILAPELDVTDWLNTPEPLKLSELRDKIVVIHAFQMLCPGCVSHGLPQASLIHEFYSQDNVQVIGLHTVFEHHSVMNADALKAFVNEYQIRFPIAIDKPSEKGAIPITMKKYQLQGTPSLVLIDQHGQIRLNHFGRLSDIQIGNAIGQLLS